MENKKKTGKLFRNLTADEIEVRINKILGNYDVELVLYKNARTDMDLLDEKFGPMNWKREHTINEDNRMLCTVSIRNAETGEWISKSDVGTESSYEKEKGQASDSFKRACVNWGIGRELYSAPRIIIPAAFVNYATNKDGKKVTYDTFYVRDYKCDDKTNRIVALAIANQDGKIVFFYDPQDMAGKKKAEKSAQKEETLAEESTPAKEVAPTAQTKKKNTTKTTKKEKSISDTNTVESDPGKLSSGDIIPDVGDFGKPLRELSLVQLRWIYLQTKKGEIREAICDFLKDNQDAKNLFAAQGISID